MPLIDQQILNVAEKFSSHVAVKDRATQKTYADLYQDITRIARGISERSISIGDRVLVFLPNSSDFVISHLAILTAGAVSVPVEYNINPKNLREIVKTTQPKAIFTDAKSIKRVSQELPLNELPLVLCCDSDMESINDLNVSNWLAASQIDGPNKDFYRHRSENDLAQIMFTTGSTGTPKGVLLSHHNVTSAISNISQFLSYSSADREVITLPLSHNFGLGHAYCNLVSGGGILLENGLIRMGAVLDSLVTFNATGFPGTPMGFGIILDRYRSIFAEKAKDLRFIVVNSAPLPPERMIQLQETLPHTDIFVYYGLTEASRSTFISLSKGGSSLYRSVGKPMPGVKIKLDHSKMDANSGKHDEGEVMINGPSVSRGYWIDQDKVQEIQEQGWLRTGDIGRVDSEGNLFITGRFKDIINVGGYKFNPSEVENVLKIYPGISEVCVVGLSGLPNLEGEVPVAAIIWNGDSNFDPVACESYCLESLEKFKIPVRFFCRTSIPRSETGKPKRLELAKELIADW